MKIIKAESDREKRKMGQDDKEPRLVSRARRESSVVSRENTAGDGRIMTGGGALLDPSRPFPASGCCGEVKEAGADEALM